MLCTVLAATARVSALRSSGVICSIIDALLSRALLSQPRALRFSVDFLLTFAMLWRIRKGVSKIKQIAVAGYAKPDGGYEEIIVCIDEDGIPWRLSPQRYTGKQEWERLPTIGEEL